MSTGERVRQLRLLRRYDEAEREARQALAAEPENAKVLMELAAAQLAAGKLTDGLATAEAAVALSPRYEWPHRIRAHLLSRLGRHHEAVQAGYVAVGLAPEEALAAVGYATVLQRAGRLADAMRVARHAVALDPDSPDAHLRVADIAAQQGDRVIARRAYARTLELDPQNAGARHDLAVLDLNSRRPARALGGLVDAGRLDPTLPHVMRTVSAVLWRLSWRIRIWLLVTAWIVAGTAGRTSDDPQWPVRIAGLVVLVATAALGWWTVRELPCGVLPVIRQALRSDRPLRFTYWAVAVCVVIYVAVVVTGLGLLASVVFLILGLLGLLAGAVGIMRTVAARRKGRNA